MKILMTNNTLSWRGGTELYIRDLASALRHRGHSVIAYSTELGPIADEMRQAGIAVVDDLGSITETPDVIHAHHHLDAAAAAMRFPAAPVVNACHGWSPWQEAPLPRPLATRYVAVSQMTRERLVTSGVPTDRIAIIPNFVDTARFDKVRPAGAPIRRALAYGNPWRPGDRALAVLRERCVARGLEFEAIGGGMGNGTDCPERLLPEFDLVFAMGRSALEAMACGCAVVVADPQGIGGLVTPANVQAMADANFGLALVVGNPVTAQAVGALIDAAGAHDAAAVTRLVRQQMDIGRAVALWEAQYKLALEDAARSKDDLIAGIQTYLIQQKGRNYSFEHRARVAEAQAETVSAECLIRN